FLGHAEETEAHVYEALRLSPRDIFAYRWMMIVGIAKVQVNADTEAVAWLRRSIDANRNFPLAHFHLAAALALLGSLDEARAAAQVAVCTENSHPDVVVMESAQDLERFDAPGPLNRARNRRILVQ